jgi:competence CoiA-like predicted nuclease
MNLTGHNVTIEARAFATPVNAPEIVEVIDLVSGEVQQTKTFIAGHRYSELVEARVGMREALKNEQPRHICAICGTPVYLVANMHKRFFFRHKTEDGSCPAITRGALSEEEIRARKYRGLRESEAHKRLKQLIERSLRADSAFETEAIIQEKRWTSAHDPKMWRKPDVQAVSTEGRFAFEAQLSTTFLDVVVSRRMFYRDEGAHLIWVLASFSEDYRRMTTDDLLFSNNSNVFVVDDETVGISEETKRFHLRCHHRVPFCDADCISDKWQEAIVPFSAVKTEIERQRAYYFDYEVEEARCSETLDQQLRDEVIAYWTENITRHREETLEHLDRWQVIKERLAARKVAVPDHPARDSSFRAMMHAVLSALKGQAVGWQFDTLIQCAHQTAQGHAENLLAFAFAVEVAGNKELLKSQDLTGKWAKRCEAMRIQLRKRDPKYAPPPAWMPALSFLFPEVGARVAEFVRRNGWSIEPLE